MGMVSPWRFTFFALASWCCCRPVPAAEIFRVATYNVESYLDQPLGGRPVKSAEARAKVREA